MSKDVKLLFDGDLLIVNANLCERGIREALESLYSAYRVRLRTLSARLESDLKSAVERRANA